MDLTLSPMLEPQSDSDFNKKEVTFEQPYQRLIGFTALVNEED